MGRAIHDQATLADLDRAEASSQSVNHRTAVLRRQSDANVVLGSSEGSNKSRSVKSGYDRRANGEVFTARIEACPKVAVASDRSHGQPNLDGDTRGL
jgi:hypothetical protein